MGVGSGGSTQTAESLLGAHCGVREQQATAAIPCPDPEGARFQEVGRDVAQVRQRRHRRRQPARLQYGPSFYLNLGVYFRAVGARTDPLAYHCHIRTRLSKLVPTDSVSLNSLTSSNPVPDHVRFAELENLLVDHACLGLNSSPRPRGRSSMAARFPLDRRGRHGRGRKFLGLARGT